MYWLINKWRTTIKSAYAYVKNTGTLNNQPDENDNNDQNISQGQTVNQDTDDVFMIVNIDDNLNISDKTKTTIQDRIRIYNGIFDAEEYPVLGNLLRDYAIN